MVFFWLYCKELHNDFINFLSSLFPPLNFREGIFPVKIGIRNSNMLHTWAPFLSHSKPSHKLLIEAKIGVSHESTQKIKFYVIWLKGTK